MSINELVKDKTGLVGDELYSFDIFDTLITRKTATPEGIFAIMQNVLLNDEKYFNIPLYIRENFFNYRKKAEQFKCSYNNYVNHYRDCNFDEIYEFFQNNFLLSKNDIELLKNLELSTEYENLLPIEKNIQTVKDLIAQNKRVVLISDMYHSSETIRTWLLKFDDIFKDIQIYVSNEYKSKKSDTELYKAIKTIENINFCNWIHTGDNIISDLKNAKELGIYTNACKPHTLTNYQRFVLNNDKFNLTNVLSIGCSKNLTTNSTNSKYILGASLAAPILVPYVLWVLEEARKHGYETLYFVARDGYFLKEIADFIIKERNINIQTKYIYGSRLAWQGAAFCVSPDIIGTVFEQYGNTNLEFLAKIFNIDFDDFIKFIPKKYFKKKKCIRAKTKNDFFEYMKNNKEFISHIVEKNKIKHKNLVGYLKQEIDFTQEKFAFVDLSGSGVTQECLATVINQFDKRVIDCYYLRNTAYKFNTQHVNLHYFIFECKGFGAVIELLARAPHGQTLSYGYDKGQYYPIFDENNLSLFNWDFNSFRNGILDFTKEYLELKIFRYFDEIDSSIPNLYTNWLTANIDKEISTELGSIAHSPGGTDEKYEYAPAITLTSAIFSCLALGKFDTNNYNISFARSGRAVKNILKFTKKYKNFWQWLLKININKSKNIAMIRLFGINISFKKLLWGI